MFRVRFGQSRLHVRAHVAAPVARVFERITDHEAMAEWPGVTACRLIVEGEPRNGLGAVRRIRTMGLTLDERVVEWLPAEGYDYQIIRGLPVEHRGTVRLSQSGSGTEVSWTVTLRSRVPLVAELTGAALRLALPRALRYFSGTFAN
jgi:uncharacterized protein YndB with AHSA1/START domain